MALRSELPFKGKELSREIAAEAHATQRLQERYLPRKTPGECRKVMFRHLALILAEEARYLGTRPEDGRKLYQVEEHGRVFMPVFDPTINRIVTYLPADGRAGRVVRRKDRKAEKARVAKANLGDDE